MIDSTTSLQPHAFSTNVAQEQWTIAITAAVVGAVLGSLLTHWLHRRTKGPAPPTATEIALEHQRLEHEREDRQDQVAAMASAKCDALWQLVSEHKQALLKGTIPKRGFEVEILGVCEEVRKQVDDVRGILRNDDVADAFERLLGKYEREYPRLAQAVMPLRAEAALGVLDRNELMDRIRAEPFVVVEFWGLPSETEMLRDRFRTLQPRRRRT